MTAPLGVGYAIVDHLRENGVRMSDRTAASIRTIVDLAPRYGRLGDLLEAEGMGDSTVRMRLTKKHLPRGRQWFMLGRALAAVREIQAQPGAPLLCIGLTMGYEDHSGVVRVLRRTLGITTGTARNADLTALATRWVDREVLACAA